ncbi:MAG: hypothetical protein MMC33_007694 [Icmadophila ericetorum]|nr:hypothetical protein [Icmadophila ericetorum]
MSVQLVPSVIRNVNSNRQLVSNLGSAMPSEICTQIVQLLTSKSLQILSLEHARASESGKAKEVGNFQFQSDRDSIVQQVYLSLDSSKNEIKQQIEGQKTLLEASQQRLEEAIATTSADIRQLQYTAKAVLLQQRENRCEYCESAANDTVDTLSESYRHLKAW